MQIIPRVQYPALQAPPPEPIYTPEFWPEQRTTVVTFPYQIQYKALTYTPEPIASAEEVTLDKWWRDLDRPVYEIERRDVGQQLNDPARLLDAEATTVDRWYMAWGIPTLLELRQHREFFFQEDTAEEITLDKWYINWPEWLVRNELRDIGSFLTDPARLLDAEATTVDRWHVPWPEYLNRYEVRDIGGFWIDPARLLDPEATTVDRWYMAWPEVTRDWERSGAEGGLWLPDYARLLDPETTTVDRWYAPWPEITRDFERNGSEYGLFLNDVARLLDTEVTTVDRWIGYTGQPVFLQWAPEGLYLLQLPPDLLVAPEDITLDKWYTAWPTHFLFPLYPQDAGQQLHDLFKLIVNRERGSRGIIVIPSTRLYSADSRIILPGSDLMYGDSPDVRPDTRKV